MAKANKPLRKYCTEDLGMIFKGNYSYCPMHGGNSGTVFQIDDQTNTWQCWSECRERCPRHSSNPIEKTKPCICRGDWLDLEKLTKGRKAPHTAQSGSGEGWADKRLFVSQRDKPDLSLSHLPDVDVRKHSPIAKPQAKDFAQWFLSILGGEDLPIVFHTKYQAIVGDRARKALSLNPQGLQYLYSCTALRSGGSNTKNNLKERLFLDIEFDDMPDREEQLKVLWWFKRVRKWNLVSITFSGGPARES